LILGVANQGDADYLNACRSKRNIAEYDRTGVVSAGEAEELLAFVQELREKVMQWVRKHHSALL
jgi:hypothetical protein